MTLWSNTALLGLYTLSPTHCGTGQTTGAVDLPIARNAATGFPVLPASGIKGVLRDVAKRGSGLAGGTVKDLFGPEISAQDEDDGLSAGRLAFTEARLLAYPARSLSRPYFHVTCRLIVDVLVRDLRALGVPEAIFPTIDTTSWPADTALVADASLAGQAVVLEDLIYPDADVRHDKGVTQLADALANLIPETEQATRRQLQDGLVVLPDTGFDALMHLAVPVQARVKLTGGKTTDTWENPETLEKESGNLWYEEFLPSDCLFLALIGERRTGGGSRSGNGGSDRAGLSGLIKARDAFPVVQIGGNETVGYGVTLCTMLAANKEGASG